MGQTYRGGKSGCKIVTLFDSYSYDGGVLVYGSYLYRGGKSGCKMVTLFDSYSYDGVSAGIWVIHTEVARKFYVIVHILPLPEA